ncbi:MAG: CBS domain-containing protein [Cellulosilyticaceae bacterium]
MLVKNIMIPLEKLSTVSTQNTVEETIKFIDDNKLLSLPVVDDGKFVGIISKKYIFEEYFNVDMDKAAFNQLKIEAFMKTKLESVNERDLVELPARILSENNLQFIPVVDEKNKFSGIVTHKAIFKTFTKILGFGHTRLEIVTRDGKGRLAHLTEIISKQDTNIISIAEIDVELMNLREIILRVDTKNTNKLVQALNEGGFRVTRVNEQVI